MLIKTKKGLASLGVELIGQTKTKELIYRVPDDKLPRLAAKFGVEYEEIGPKEVYIRYHAMRARVDMEFAYPMAERALIGALGVE